MATAFRAGQRSIGRTKHGAKTRRSATGMEAKLKIKKRFQELCPPLSTGERQQLLENIQDSGILDRIKVWQGWVIDGHNRYEIAQELDIEFDVEELDFADENEVCDWIIHNQLGRRNLDPDAASYLRGKLYNHKKKATVGRPNKLAQSGPINSTAEVVAKDTGVSRNTVKRDGAYAEAVDSLAPKARQAVEQKEIKASRKDVERLAERDEDTQADIVETVQMGDQPNLKAALDAEEVEADDERTDVDVAIEMAPEFKSKITQLTSLMTWVKDMAGGPAGRHLQDNFRKIEADIKNARQAIKFAAPHKPCPYCGGDVDHETRSCEACMGWGWVNRIVYDNAPSEMKK